MISIIIPIHNEEEMVAKYEEVLYPFIPENSEVILVDDGSTDNSWSLIKGLASRKDTHGVYLKKNRGMGGALKCGIRASHGDLIIFLDADLTFRPTDIAVLVTEYNRNPVNCVSGSPYMRPGLLDEVHLHRLFLSKGVKVLYQILLSDKITSVSPVFRAYERQVFDKLEIKSDGFEINSEIVSKMILAGMTVTEVPITLHCRTYGKSKGNIPRSIRNHLVILWKIVLYKYLGKEW